MRRLIPLLLFAACSDGPAFEFAVVFEVTSPSQIANDAHPLIRWTQPGALRFVVSVWTDENRTTLIERIEVLGTKARMTTALSDGDTVWVEVDSPKLSLRTPLRRFDVLLVPDHFPGFELVRSDPLFEQGGYKLFNLLDVFGPSLEERVPAMVLVNAAAEVAWWYTFDAIAGHLTDLRALPGGTLTFIARETGPAPVTSVAYEMTWDGQIVWQSRPGIQVHHEVTQGPGGNRLYLKWVFQDFLGVSHEGDALELVDPATNEVLWEWNIFDHFLPADFQVPEVNNPGLSGKGVDWSHANAAVWDEARGLIWVSVRHFDRIIGIDYPSGEVRVTIGQDGLGGDGYMSHQHAPEIQDDGSILFWDNGNGHSPPRSSAKMFSFDEATGAFNSLFEWSDSPSFFDFAVGDADRQPNGNILITAGVSRRIIEIDPGGRKIWELMLGGARHWIYRTQQVPASFIPPGTLPFDR